jgi:medium-chain acyl-[acyl-carrier-protein] hydrolase
VYHHWSSRLPKTIEVCAIQCPGRESRIGEPTYSDLSVLASAIAEVVAPLLDLPYAVFGHSLGALVAFEFARHVSAGYGGGLRHLFPAACRPPHLPPRNQVPHSVPDSELVMELRRLGGTPSAVLESDALLALTLPVLRADLRLYELYRAKGLLPIPITAFCGTADPEVLPGEMREWAGCTTSAFRLRLLDGGHFFVNTAFEALLAAMAEELSQFCE